MGILSRSIRTVETVFPHFVLNGTLLTATEDLRRLLYPLHLFPVERDAQALYDSRISRLKERRSTFVRYGRNTANHLQQRLTRSILDP
jgi:hypothetical protein